MPWRKLLNLDLPKKLPFPGKKGKKVMQNGTCNVPYRCWEEAEAVLLCLEMVWIPNSETQETFSFHTLSFHFTSPVQKVVKDIIILTLMSNMLYFNCLSYEMVQHKLNWELSNITEAIYVTHCKITRIFSIMEFNVI